MESKPVYIYGLWDPRTLELRYIGKAENPEQRYIFHVNDAKAERDWYNPHKGRWIRQLLSEGLEPCLEILEECTLEDWTEVETAWIKEAKEKGARLINITEGGYSGAFKGRKHTEQSRQLMSQKLKGRQNPNKGKKMNLSPETRQRMSLRNRGENNPMYGSNRVGESNPMWGREQSDHTRGLIRARVKSAYSDPTRTPWYGKQLTDEHKEKISRSKTGKKMSQDFVDNLKVKMTGELNPMYGKGHSEVARQKIAICSKLHAANKRGDLASILELQEEYFAIYGKYNGKYPHRVSE